MTEQLRAANLETAYGNARALCYDIDAEMIYPAFDIAMDMARRLNEVLYGSASSRSLKPAAVDGRHDAAGMAQRAAGRTAQ